MSALFEGVPERYAKRNGGYTRIKRPNHTDRTIYRRRGDGVEMAVIELLDGPEEGEESKEAAPAVPEAEAAPQEAQPASETTA